MSRLAQALSLLFWSVMFIVLATGCGLLVGVISGLIW